MSIMHCRLCALKSEKSVNIYASENSNMELDAKIASCLQIWVDKKKHFSYVLFIFIHIYIICIHCV